MQRKGKRAYELIGILGTTVLLFTAPLGKLEHIVFSILLCIFCAGVTILRVQKKEGYDEI